MLDNAVCLLVQINTDSHQSASQTLLRAVELHRKRGATLVARDVAVPGVPSDHSASVNEGERHFAFAGGKLVISGAYDLRSEKSSPTRRAPTRFTVALAADLRRRWRLELTERAHWATSVGPG